ncbi:type I-E CRISPR-associated protein Cse1/CasA [Kitasatospora sp. NPDC090308]|uniref:type I-E CRISPR-associated protein Cse1/CasA n=1 Tax=Kitasatospora sp. NPDC090308 TaxID=3364082 RepID=UPI00382ABB5C
MPVYNLADEPWLAPRLLDGGPPVHLGIAETLTRADEFDGLSVDFATQLPAVLRQVLLPVVVAALGAPETAAAQGERLARGGFTVREKERLLAYLAEHRARFDLFDEAVPFAQVAGLRTAKGETKGAAVLVVTAASGNNVPLFASRSDADQLDLTPAQAVHWLLHTHCWDTAAIKTGVVGDDKAKAGKTMGNPTGPLGQLGVIVPMGRTLYETLQLNIPVTAGANLGKPQWERPPGTPAWEQRSATGLLDLWTWQARRVRLIPHQDDGGALKVARVVISAGDRLSTTPEWEPHTAWTFTAPAKKTPNHAPERRPRRHPQGKAVWRGLDALLAPVRQNDEGVFETSVLLDRIGALQEDAQLPADYPLRVETFGMVYGTQSSVVEDVVHDTIPLPLLALQQDSGTRLFLLDVAEQAERLARALNDLSADLRRAIGADPIPWDKGQRPGEPLLHVLDRLVRRMLAGARAAGGDEELLERGRFAWEEAAARRTWEQAAALLAAAPAGAFTGRTVSQTGKQGKTRTFSLGRAADKFRREVHDILPRHAHTARATARDRSGALDDTENLSSGDHVDD